jgi:hypothetical protein
MIYNVLSCFISVLSQLPLSTQENADTLPFPTKNSNSREPSIQAVEDYILIYALDHTSTFINT